MSTGMTSWQADDTGPLPTPAAAEPPPAPPSRTSRAAAPAADGTPSRPASPAGLDGDTPAGPWQRLLARLFDLCWELSVLTIPLGIVLPQPDLTILLLAATVCLPIAILLDALVYRFFGNTPGKALLGLKVVDSSGDEPDPGLYLTRNGYVYLHGLGAGVPFVWIGTLLYQAYRLRSGRRTSYDEALGCSVVAEAIETVQKLIFSMALAVLLTVSLTAGYYLSTAPSGREEVRSVAQGPSAAARKQIQSPLSSGLRGAPARLRSVRFTVKDSCDDGISVVYRLFDMNGDAVWPSGDKTFETSALQTPNTSEVTCTPGHLICFGAARNSASPTLFLGVGLNREQREGTAAGCVVCGTEAEKFLEVSCPRSSEKANVPEKQADLPRPAPQKQKKPSPAGTAVDTGFPATSPVPETRVYEKKEPPKHHYYEEDKAPIDIQSLTPEQRLSIEYECFSAKSKGELYYDQCIRSKLNKYR